MTKLSKQCSTSECLHSEKKIEDEYEMKTVSIKWRFCFVAEPRRIDNSVISVSLVQFCYDSFLIALISPN
jgi:hypothetical protein